MNDLTKEALNTIFDVVPTTGEVPAPTDLVPTVEVLPVVSSTTLPPDGSEEERLAREDFEFSRGALKSVASESQNTLHRAVDVANQTDTPRAFEAVGDLVRATLEAHRELQSLHKTAAEIRATKATASVSTVNVDKGIVFHGGADELLRLIDPSRK